MKRLLFILIMLLQFSISNADELMKGVYYSSGNILGRIIYYVYDIDENAGKHVVIPDVVTIPLKNGKTQNIHISKIDFNNHNTSIKTNSTLETLEAKFVEEITISNDYRLTNLTKIVLGENLKKIGFLNKERCPNLKDLQWEPDKVVSITSFSGQTEIFNETLRFGTSLKEIGENAFNGCHGIQTVDLSKCTNLKIIGKGAFSCSDLKDIKFANGLLVIYDEAFKDCKELFPGSTGTLNIPETCTEIGHNAFEGCTKLENVKAYGWKIGSASQSQSGSQFSGCTSLTSVSLPDNLDYIPNSAFANCENLKYITTKSFQNQAAVIFPKTVKIIAKKAFSGCKSLTNLLKNRDIDMPDAIEKVDEEAFSNCTGLISISFPHPVDREIIAYTNSFEKCTNLKHITLREPPKEDDEQNGVAKTQAYSASYSTKGGLVIKAGAFNGCTSLCSLPAPAGVKSWNKGYNEGWKITAIYTPYYVKDVAKDDIDALVHPNIFSLTDIKTVYFHSSTMSISQDALSLCGNVEKLVFYAPTAEEQSDSPTLNIAPMAFVSNRKLINVECDYLTPPAIDENVFSNETYSSGCLIVPEGSVDFYRAANGWKNFKMISTDGQQSSIKQIEADSNDTPAEYFDLQGRPVTPDRLVRGLYIRRQGGVSSKVVIR